MNASTPSMKTSEQEVKSKRSIRVAMATIVVAAFSVVVALAALAATGQQRKTEPTLLDGYRRPTTTPTPEGNPMTSGKVALGKLLFFDPRLSGSGAISCSTCHSPSLGWQDGLPKGVGHHGAVLARRTPTILNVAWGEPFFWDGRADTLEDQAKGPLMANMEMAGSSEKLLSFIRNSPAYRERFAQVFANEPLSIENVAKALASYERTIVSAEAPFDRWVRGDEQALSSSAKRGFVLFNTRAKCSSCHVGWRFTDDGFHDIGLPGNDMGRAKVAPGLIIFERAFKTPTLRNIAERAPYMHDGSLSTLAQVVDHYSGRFIRRPSLSDQITPLNISERDKADLIAFMKSLSSQDLPVAMPILPN